MKVLHLTDHLPNYHQNWGGAEQVAYRYICLLTNSKKIETIVGGTTPVKSINENFKFIKIFVIEDFFPKKFQVYLTGIKNRIFSFDPLSFFHLLLNLIKEKPNIIHLHKTNKISLFSPILAAKILKIKVVLSMYDYWYFCPAGMLIDQGGNLCHKFHGPWCKNCNAVSDFRFLLPFTSPFRRSIFNFFYKFIDAFTVLSQSQAEILKAYGLFKKKVFLIRQPFDLKKSSKRNNHIFNKTIFFAGWLDPRKGLHILIEAMPKILKTIPETKLLILELQGIKDYKEKILTRIKELKIKNKIQFLGRVSKEEFEKLLEKSDIVVVPEQWENMSPVIIIEAMNKGKPIVASKIGGIPEFIKDKKSGLLAKKDNPGDFAKKIVWLLKNPKRAKILGKNAKKTVAILCNKKEILNNLIKLYKSL